MEDLKKLLAAATPGPWKIERGKRCIQGPDTFEGDPVIIGGLVGGSRQWSNFPFSEYCVPGKNEGDANAALIVAAVNALPELLVIKAERDRAQRACEQMGERIAELAKERERRVEWQPIETAPRDGQDILVYCQDSSEMFVGFSNPDEIAADPGIFFYALRTDGRRIGCRPHLWRPLPTPPATLTKDTP